MTLTMGLSKNSQLKGEAFNFSNETQKTVLELTFSILKMLGADLTPVIEGKNHGEIQAQYLDSSKAKDMLSWVPKFGLEEGLRKTINWYKKYFEEKNV